jgi:hypothetical protein
VDGVKLLERVNESKPLSVCPLTVSGFSSFSSVFLATSADDVNGLKEVAFKLIDGFTDKLANSAPLFYNETLTF